MIRKQAIFAVPADQKVLASEMGRKWFIATIGLFSVAIFFIAYFLGGILKFVRELSIRQSIARLWHLGIWQAIAGLVKARGPRVGNSKA